MKTIAASLLVLAAGWIAVPQDRAPRFPWSPAEASALADRYNDPNLLDPKYLEVDLEAMGVPLHDDLLCLPFPQVAFNTPRYDLTERVMPGLGCGPMVAEGCEISSAWVHQPLDFDTIPEGKEWTEVIVSEPLLTIVVNGPELVTNLRQWAISRSHPHYFFQGTFASNAGEVDWAAIRMADGTPIGIVNGRVLDLDQGNLVLVRQEEDGSVRIFQDRQRLEAAHQSKVKEQITQRLQQTQARAFLGLR